MPTGPEHYVHVLHGSRTIGTIEGRTPIAFSPDGALLFVSTRLYELPSFRPIESFVEVPHAWYPRAAAFSPDASRLVLGSAHGILEIRDLQQQSVLAIATQLGPIDKIAFDANGYRIAAMGSGRVEVYRTGGSAVAATTLDAPGVFLDGQGWRAITLRDGATAPGIARLPA